MWLSGQALRVPCLGGTATTATTSTAATRGSWRPGRPEWGLASSMRDIRFRWSSLYSVAWSDKSENHTINVHRAVFPSNVSTLRVNGMSMFRTMPLFTPATKWKCLQKTPLSGKTRPGVQQCQAQGLVFCPWLGLIQDRTSLCKINKSEFFSLNM